MYDAVEPIYTPISDIASCETSLNPNAVAANPIRRRLGARRASYGRIYEYGYVNVRTGVAESSQIRTYRIGIVSYRIYFLSLHVGTYVHIFFI